MCFHIYHVVIRTHVGLSMGCFSTWQLASARSSNMRDRERERQRERERERKPQDKSQTFYDLTLEETDHHYCHILFVTSESRNPAHIPEEGITQGCEHQEVASQGATQRLSTTVSKGVELQKGFSKLQLEGLPQTFVNKVLLAHSTPICLPKLSGCICANNCRVESLGQRPYSLQAYKYSLSEPLQKSSAEPYSRWVLLKMYVPMNHHRASLVVQVVKNLPAMQET